MSQPKSVALLAMLLVGGFVVFANADQNVVLIRTKSCNVNVPELHVNIHDNDSITWQFKSNAVAGKDSATIQFPPGNSPCKQSPPPFTHPNSTTCTIDTTIAPPPNGKTYKYTISNSNGGCSNDPTVVVEDGRPPDKTGTGTKTH